jgi:hypothetical protein
MNAAVVQAVPDLASLEPMLCHVRIAEHATFASPELENVPGQRHHQNALLPPANGVHVLPAFVSEWRDALNRLVITFVNGADIVF